jgi:hypothetical protein
MKAQHWTKAVQKELDTLGQKMGYEIESGKEMRVETAKDSLKVRPDIVWWKNGEPKIIFEIDQFSRGYQKTIYGSLLQGLVLAKHKGAKFVEIVPNDTSGEKACRISEILKMEFNDLPEFTVIKTRKSEALDSADRHAKYDLKKKLDEIHAAKCWNAYY